METVVLVVDDDALARRGLARSLRARLPGVEILEAIDGADAIDRMGNRVIDVVISDLRMPRMDGFELLGWMHSHRPETRVLFMTAHTKSLTSSELRSLDGVELLNKPIDVGVVETALRKIVRGEPIGHLSDVSIASFLQLLQMERKTCMLEVQIEGGSGLLYLLDGEVIDAVFGTLVGDDAALSLCGGEACTINVIRCSPEDVPMEPRVNLPLSHLLMESARLHDEDSRPADRASEQAEADPDDPLNWNDDDEDAFLDAFEAGGGGGVLPPKSAGAGPREVDRLGGAASAGAASAADRQEHSLRPVFDLLLESPDIFAVFLTDYGGGELVSIEGAESQRWRSLCESLSRDTRLTGVSSELGIQDLMTRAGSLVLAQSWYGDARGTRCLGIVGRGGTQSEARLRRLMQDSRQLVATGGR